MKAGLTVSTWSVFSTTSTTAAATLTLGPFARGYGGTITVPAASAVAHLQFVTSQGTAIVNGKVTVMFQDGSGNTLGTASVTVNTQ